MSKIIKLTIEEIGYGSYAGLKQFNKSYYKTQGNRNKLESHISGKLGEIAYSKYTGHRIDLEHYEGRGDGGLDAADGAQIKTVSWTGPNKQLKVNRKELQAALKDPRINKFVLLAMDPGKGGAEVELIGWISKENFHKKHHTENKWGDDLLLIDENQLDHYFKNDTHQDRSESNTANHVLRVC